MTLFGAVSTQDSRQVCLSRKAVAAMSQELGDHPHPKQNRFIFHKKCVRNGQSMVGGPKRTKMGQNGLFWSILVSPMLKSSSDRNKGILTKMVVWTILDHSGPVHFPTAPQPLPSVGGELLPSQQAKIHAYFLGAELRFQYTYTYVNNSEHHRF